MAAKQKLCSELDSWKLLPHTFAQQCSKKEWIPFPYLIMLGRMIYKAIMKGGGRIIISMPPRHGKSEFLSYWVITWFLELFQRKRVILCTYEAGLAQSYGRKVRNEIVTNPLITCGISDDSKAANRWSTTKGGGMITAGIGGPITGRGGDLLLIDDPLKNRKEAESELIREGQKEWFNSTFYTRQEPGATIVVLMTRWHEDDLAGWLELEHTDDWQIFRLEAINESLDDPIGRKMGEALCPQRYNEEVLAKIKAGVGPKDWGSLFQQSPVPTEGNIINPSWWNYYTDLPEVDGYMHSWDLSFEAGKTNAFNVGQVWGWKGPNYYLLAQYRKQISFTEQLKAVIQLGIDWPDHREICIEKAANGAALLSVLREHMSRLIAITVKGSKELRCEAIAPMVEAGNVWLPKNAPWIGDFVNEFTLFPNSKYKDQVDAASQALLRLRGQRGITVLPSSIIKSSMLSGLT